MVLEVSVLGTPVSLFGDSVARQYVMVGAHGRKRHTEWQEVARVLMKSSQ